MPPHQKTNSPQQNQIPKQLEPELIKAIIDQQGQKIQLELQRLDLEKQRLGYDAKLAEKSMENQAAYLKTRPSEQRKTLTRIAYIIAGIVGIFLFFIGFLLYTGNKDFADTFLKFCSYVVATVGSFIAGRKTAPNKESSKNSDDSIQDAEIIDE